MNVCERIKENIGKVIIGKEDVIDQVLVALLAGGHILIQDVPGTGKTKLCKALAASIDSAFNRIQFTPDLLPADVTGINVYNQRTSDFEFHPGPVFTNILLADEINRATPRTQSSLLECMEEKQVTVDGMTMKLEEPFFLIATQNPVETTGTYPLPEAQMDRFTMRISMGYPSSEQEMDIIKRFMVNDPLANLSPVCTGYEIMDLREKVKNVKVHDVVIEYITQIVAATRDHKGLTCGVNPRGTLSLVRCAQALAFINNRDYVTPDDVRDLCIPVLAHRLFAHSMRETEKVQGILEEILASVPVPTEEWE